MAPFALPPLPPRLLTGTALKAQLHAVILLMTRAPKKNPKCTAGRHTWRNPIVVSYKVIGATGVRLVLAQRASYSRPPPPPCGPRLITREASTKCGRGGGTVVPPELIPGPGEGRKESER